MNLGVARAELGAAKARLCLAQEEGMPFLQQLQAEAMRNADDPINEMMQRMCAPLVPPALLRTAVACEIQSDSRMRDGDRTAIPL